MIEPKRVFHYFKEVSNIPRPSGNEEGISNYLRDTGNSLGLKTIQDEFGNVIIFKPASLGYETSPVIILQGHMDMVPEKSADSTHDFNTDPIMLLVEGDIIKGYNTTLGADNGIALGIILAILEDSSLKHGPIEAVFTTSEETTMAGANGISENILNGKYLINVDSEDEGVLTAGSAGGIQYIGQFIFSLETIPEDLSVYTVNFSGLLGGHSGMEIDSNRGNIIKIMADFMEKSEGCLIDFDSGTKHNAIPRMGSIKIAMETSPEKLVEEILEKYGSVEGELSIEVVPSTGDTGLSRESTKDFAKYLLEIPTGVNSYTGGKKFVESSSNLAIVKKLMDRFTIEVSIRSSANAKQEELVEKFTEISKKYGVEYSFGNSYPTWEYRETSHLREIALLLYREMYKKDLKVEITHGGLECGVFYEKYPDIDIISIGPNIRGAHTPDECLSISSTERIYNFILKLMEKLI